MEKERLVTPSYCCILAANFLLYFGFWLLTPVLPFYLSEIFNASKTTIGIVLSCYTISSLCIRPFSGYFLDTFARKPLYLLAYFIFTLIFAGYMIAGLLTLFIIFRIVHGISFGMVTVGGNTVVIDIMPSSRRGEGLGYYGLANNLACPSDRCSDCFYTAEELPILLFFPMRSDRAYSDSLLLLWLKHLINLQSRGHPYRSTDLSY